MDLSAPSTTASSSSYLLGIYYDKVLLENLYPSTRMYQLVEKKPIPKGIAKTITFTKLTKLTASENNLTEGVPPSPTWLSSTQITATLIQKGAYVPISDLLSMTAIDPIIEDAATELGQQAASTIDKYIMYRCFGDYNSGIDAEDIFGSSSTLDFSNIYKQHNTAAYQGFSTVFFSQDGTIPTIAVLKSFLTTVSAATANEYGLRLDTVRRAANLLKKDNVPAYADGCYVMVVSPESELNLLRDADFQAWNQYQNADKMFNGEIGKIAGVRFVSSTNIPKTCTSTLSVGTVFTGVFNILLAPKGIAVTEIDGHIHMKVKAAGSAGSVDPLDQVSTIGWKWTGVAKVLDEARGKIIMTLLA